DARAPAVEVVAGAVPLTGVEADVVGVVVATEGERETVDRDPIELSRVPIRLLDLADQRTVHRATPPPPRRGDQAAVVRSAPRPGCARHRPARARMYRRSPRRVPDRGAAGPRARRSIRPCARGAGARGAGRFRS